MQIKIGEKNVFIRSKHACLYQKTWDYSSLLILETVLLKTFRLKVIIFWSCDKKISKICYFWTMHFPTKSYRNFRIIYTFGISYFSVSTFFSFSQKNLFFYFLIGIKIKWTKKASIFFYKILLEMVWWRYCIWSIITGLKSFNYHGW